VWFRGGKIGDFRPDLIVGNLVVAELKAARTLEPFHEAQLLIICERQKLKLAVVEFWSRREN
jgi:GxxExxY protein